MVFQKATGVTSMTQGLSVTYNLSFQGVPFLVIFGYESWDLDRETYYPAAKRECHASGQVAMGKSQPRPEIVPKGPLTPTSFTSSKLSISTI
jgi:hypothetical protein